MLRTTLIALRGYRGKKIQGENPCQVLLVLPGLMSVRIALCGEAALVSIKESYFYTPYEVYEQLLWRTYTCNMPPWAFHDFPINLS